MSNIAGLHSSNDSNNNSGYRRANIMGSIEENNGNPRQESFGAFLKNTCCPSFQVYSVVFIISIIDVVIFIATLCFGIKKDANELLSPTFNTLDKFGMKIPQKIQKGQVWRWITFGVLHANLIHLVVNLFSQVIIGSYLERTIGHIRTLLLYVLSSIGGGIFSCLVSGASGVGASVAIFGMLGAYFGYMIVNWNYLDRTLGPMNKFCNLIFMIFIVVMNISYGFSNPIIDNYGHIGGLIYGFFLSFVIIEPEEESDGLGCKSKIWKYISFGVLAVLYVVFTVLFFTVIKYN